MLIPTLKRSFVQSQNGQQPPNTHPAVNIKPIVTNIRLSKQPYRAVKPKAISDVVNHLRFTTRSFPAKYHKGPNDQYSLLLQLYHLFPLQQSWRITLVSSFIHVTLDVHS
jgi:hypothetical protein